MSGIRIFDVFWDSFMTTDFCGMQLFHANDKTTDIFEEADR